MRLPTTPLCDTPSEPYKHDADRRRASRFLLVRDVSYRLFDHAGVLLEGTGRTLNISSGGVCFSTEHQLFPGQELQLSIDWPARLDAKIRLKLVITGRVVRVWDGTAAIAIGRYEFRTAGSRQALQPCA